MKHKSNKVQQDKCCTLLYYMRLYYTREKRETITAT